MNTFKSNLITIIKSYYKIYNTFDVSFKRYIYIDLFTVLFLKNKFYNMVINSFNFYDHN